jgi:VanZ family protein
MRWKDAVFTLAYCCGIWWLSSRSKVPHLPYEIPNLDKVAHMVLYAGLAATVYSGLRRSNRAIDARWLLYVPIVVVALYGIVDELHQAFVPRRSCSFDDWIADLTGAALFQIAVHHPWGVWALQKARVIEVSM